MAPELPRLDELEVPLLVGPAVLWFVVFLIAPLVIIGYYSFLTYSTFSVVHEFTLDAWRLTVFTPIVFDVFVRTLFIGVFTTLLTLVVGYPVAYYLRFHVSQKVGLIVLLGLVIPFWTAGVIRVMGWYPILSKTGAINFYLQQFGVIPEPLSWLMFSPVSQVAGYLQNYVVFMFAPIYVVLFEIDEGLLDASETLRGTGWATFRNVVWPLSLPGVVIGSIFVFVLSIGNFIVPQFLSGGKSTIPLLIFQQITTGLNYPAAAALSIVLLLVELFAVYLLTRVVDISEIAEG